VNRLTVAAITAVSTLAVVVGAVLSVYSVLPADDGDGFLIVSRKQARECAEGGGCAAFSARQIVRNHLRMLQEHGGQPAEQPEAKRKGRTDI
jgi:hypothetical protein